jgi:hypothetical protein
MKFVVSGTVAAMLALGLASCGDNSSSQSSPSPSFRTTCSYSEIPSSIISNLQRFEDLERLLATSVESFLADPEATWNSPIRVDDHELWILEMNTAAMSARTFASDWALYRPPWCSNTANTLVQTGLTMESRHRAWRALSTALSDRDDAALQEVESWLDELDQDLRQIACDHEAADGIDISALPRC